MRTLLVLASLVLFLLTGCPPTPSAPTEVWRPKSSLSKSAALTAITALSAAIPGSKVYSVAETHSMEPILWGNTFVVAEDVDVKDVRIGDILIWRRNGKLVIHSCVGTSGSRLTLKGYNNFSGDNVDNQFITQTDLVGRYVGHLVFDPEID